MKRILMLALAAVALAVAAPSAFATRVVFDPPTALSVTPPAFVPPLVCTGFTPCNVWVPGNSYQVDFLPCAGVPGGAGFTWCLWMNNVTGQAIGKFTFSFIVPLGGSTSGSTLQCSSIPATLATDDCPAALPAAGSLFTVSFFANPGIPTSKDFYLYTDFNSTPGSASVTAVPEPNGLALFGLGLLALGFGWQRRRRLWLGHRGA